MHGAGHGAVVSPLAYCNRRTRELANQRTHHLIFHTIFIANKRLSELSKQDKMPCIQFIAGAPMGHHTNILDLLI